jgi:hypothetical protein
LERYKTLKKGKAKEEDEKPKEVEGMEEEEDEYEDEDEGEGGRRSSDLEDVPEEEGGKGDMEKDYLLTLELLSRALAVITGHTKNSQRRSLLSCELGVTTLRVRT